MKFMTCTWPPPDLEKKSPTVYVTDPGKRQVICSAADKLSWNGNGKMSLATGIPSSLNLSTLPFVCVVEALKDLL